MLRQTLRFQKIQDLSSAKIYDLSKSIFSTGEVFSVLFQRTLAVYCHSWQNISSKAFLTFFSWCFVKWHSKQFFFVLKQNKNKMGPISHSFYSCTLLNSSKLFQRMYNTDIQKHNTKFQFTFPLWKKKIFENVSFLSYIQRGTLKIQYLPLYNDLRTQTSSLDWSKCKGSFKYALETVLTPKIQLQSLYHLFIYFFPIISIIYYSYSIYFLEWLTCKN